ncbi:MAG: anthranilate synthase family protein [Nocardioides sp.]
MSDPGALTLARSAFDALGGHRAWAAIRLRDSETVTLLGGTPHAARSLLDVPLETGPPPPGRRFDRLLAIPFRQVAERGFEAHDDGAPLVVVDIDTEVEVSISAALAVLPQEPVEFVDRGGFETDDADYARVVEAIIRDEIGQGEGANLVIGRNYRAVVADWDAAKALTVFRRLLVRERGAYWTFCLFTGDRFLIGASPERHVSVRGGDVRMNPISGTFRIPQDHASRGPAQVAREVVATGSTDRSTGSATSDRALKQALLDFLADEKEIYELFMVVDEELKMMCDICHEGGQVVGPFLKPMTHLIHTEYLLAGRTARDVREVLRDTMFAATVTGSPVENACRLIKQYESVGRGYYGSALALLGRDHDGEPTADSPIVIRTADVDLTGKLKVTAGATLVRDSEPAHEVAETRAKAGGILSAFGLVPPAPQPAEDISALARDEDVLIALNSRNRRLSTFWLTDQAGATPEPWMAGQKAVIIDGEDDFVRMLRHLLAVLGMTADIVRHENLPEDLEGWFDPWNLVIVGPGPGDPRDGNDPKIARLRRVVDHLLARRTPFLAVCLGHQTLCERLGIPLAFKDIVFQGTQSSVRIDGRTERVGFYNTFVARAPAGVLPDGVPAGVRVEADPDSGDIHLIEGPHYRGVQFHAESILTERGYDLMHELVRGVLRP